jgi:phosphohistidine phosphatase SixA
MKIILVRHAPRELNSDPTADPHLPLSPEGRDKARDLGKSLLAKGLRPEAYLTSSYAHAKETGQIMSTQTRRRKRVPVISLDSLTPHHEFSLDMILSESLEKEVDLGTLEVVVFVLHHPRLNQLVARMTKQPESEETPEYADGVCVTAASLEDIRNGLGTSARI